MNAGELMDGRFRLRDPLGAGGMAVVWRAHDEVLGRDVALKVLAPRLAHDPVLLARVRDEARAVARLRHPNIVDVYDYGEAPLPYVVMEVAEGRPLSQLLSGGALPWRLAAVIGAQVAAGLAAAHEQGVVHRDVKPGNVVVGGDRVKLVDFGISAASGDDDRAAGQLLGTPAYLAPERLEHGVVRPATDVYALGLMLYQTLAGALPWDASTATEMLRAHRYQEPYDLPPIAGLPAEVAALCRRCLAKDPGARPTAAEAATVLAAVAGLSPAILALPGHQADDEPDEAETTRVVRPRRRVALVAGAAVLLLGGGVAAAVLSGDPPRPRIEAGVAATAPRAECAVGYTVSGTADGRFTTKVSVVNTGPVAVPAASLTFSLPGEQRLRTGSPGTWRQSGRTVSAQIGDLAAGRRHTATIRGTYRAVNGLPGRFELNGTTCAAALSVVGPATTAKPAAAEPPTVRKIAEATGKSNGTSKGKGKKKGHYK